MTARLFWTTVGFLLVVPACSGEDEDCGLRGSQSRLNDDGVCECNPGYVWRNPDDDLDLTCVAVAGSTCGNQAIELGEVCDGINMAGASCETLGYDGGVLGCAADCRGLNTTGCTSSCAPQCGARVCGADPACGISCGSCATGTCNASGECEVAGCTPVCDGLQCGPDPVCGVSCGACSTGTCSASGQCEVACSGTVGCPCSTPSECNGGLTCTGGFCAAMPCGDGHCASNETAASCPADCGGRSECIGNRLTCSAMSDLDCSNQLGCYTDAYGCTGSATHCDEFLSNASCGGQQGCQWDTEDAAGTCIGNRLTCSAMSGMGCPGQLGCYEDSYGCTGSATHCDSFLGGTSCAGQAGCQWEVAAGDGVCAGNRWTCSALSTDACSDQLGCYNDSYGCTGSATHCDEFLGATSCGAQAGCQWQTAAAAGECIGNRWTCSALSTSGCTGQLGCYTDSYGCTGSATHCDEFLSAGNCGGQAGCQWETSQGGGTCIGNRLTCSAMSEDACWGQLGCYVDNYGCTGSATHCDDFQSTDSCNAQAGCQWESL